MGPFSAVIQNWLNKTPEARLLRLNQERAKAQA